MSEPDALHAIRAELDALDDEMHALLMRRAAVVARLVGSGAKPAGTVLRPGREAAILRRLLGRHDGPLPRPALVRVWREVFASSVSQQGGFAVALPAEVALGRLAVEHFGTATPLKPQPSIAAVLNAVTGKAAAAAVLPWPRESDEPAQEWWTRLDGTLHVVARLPFLSLGEPPLEAAVVALQPADPSGADLVLFRIEAAADEGRAAIAARHPGAKVLVLRREGGFSRALLEGAEAPAGAVILGRYAIPERGAA